MRRLRTRAPNRPTCHIFHRGHRATHCQNYRMPAGHQTSNSCFPALLNHIYSRYKQCYHGKTQNKQGKSSQQLTHKIELKGGHTAQQDPHPFAAKVFHGVCLVHDWSPCGPPGSLRLSCLPGPGKDQGICRSTLVVGSIASDLSYLTVSREAWVWYRRLKMQGKRFS